MSVLEIRSVSKVFSTTRAVESFDLTVGDGELVCLLGPSGSGKSTLLRMIGGFETPTSGTIRIDGEDVTHVSPERRPTGMVFQSHALWTHMNVHRNLAFGLRLRRLPKEEITRRVEAALEQVGLKGYGQRMTHQLSGGQQQRVALARSLVLEPKILLLDEPFASLDQHLRERLREEVRDLQQRLKITTLFVTHGQDEALALADRIVVMRDGRTEQIAPPDVTYREPATPFVAGFIGTMNLIDGTVTGGAFRHAGLALPVPVADGPATLAVRPEALAITPAEADPGARVHRVTDFGTHAVVDIDLASGPRLKAMVARRPRLDRRHGARPPSPRLRALPRQRGHPPQRLTMPGPISLDRDGHRTFLKWHRARRHGSDPVFTGRRILEGMAAGASVEVDLVLHGDDGFAVLHNLMLEAETTGTRPGPRHPGGGAPDALPARQRRPSHRRPRHAARRPRGADRPRRRASRGAAPARLQGGRRRADPARGRDLRPRAGREPAPLHPLVGRRRGGPPPRGRRSRSPRRLRPLP